MANYELPTSEVETLFSKSRPVRDVRLVDSPLEMPEGVEPLVRANWDQQLADKQAGILESDDPFETETRPYHVMGTEDALPALYRVGEEDLDKAAVICGLEHQSLW
tara:strand:- start:142 stop:459 length:318 start_codon:yes stop_codon:yes gene_type:complete